MVNYEIRTAEKWMLNDLINIWVECFGDSEEYIRKYYEHHPDFSHIFVAVADGRAVAMAHIIPAVMVSPEGEERLAYFGYAVGVLQDYRNRGIYKYLHQYILDYIKFKDYAYATTPAAPWLYPILEAQGAFVAFTLKKIVISAHNGDRDAVFQDLDALHYSKFRNEFLKGFHHIRWGKNELEWAILENGYCGGYCKKILYKCREYAIFVGYKHGEVSVIESTIPDELIHELGGQIVKYFNLKSMPFYVPSFSALQGEIESNGMAFNMDKITDGYLNLTLN